MPNASVVCILLFLCGIWNKHKTAFSTDSLSFALPRDGINLFLNSLMDLFRGITVQSEFSYEIES